MRYDDQQAAYLKEMGVAAAERQRKERDRMTKCTCGKPPMVMNNATGKLVYTVAPRHVVHEIGCPRAK